MCFIDRSFAKRLHYENTLDLFLVSNPSVVHNSQVIPGISKDGHHAVYVELDVSLTRRTQKPRKLFAYKKANWEEMKNDMKIAGDKIIDETTEDTPVDEILEKFSIALEENTLKHIPTRMSKPKQRPPWITLEVKRLLRKQKKLFDKQKGCAYASRASQHYRSLKAFTQREIRKAYWQYVEDIITDKDDESPPGSNKNFWRFIKHQKQEAQGVAPLKSKGKMVDDPVAKANILNNQFQSVFSSRTPLSLKSLCSKATGFVKPDGSKETIPQMPEIDITEKGVKRQLEKLNPHKAAGPDKMKPRVLKEMAEVIAPVITRIFRASLKQAKTPDAWREAHVTPVFKKGEKYKPINYRPVSLTCILCKQMEHILASQIMKHLNTNHLLYDKQHGFRSKLSCETQLIEYTADVLKTMQDRKQCDTIVMDFSKAFDKVAHNRLIFKLERIGVDVQACRWIRSFLSDRSQKVVIDGEESDPAPVTSGVPQGSVLGPILFLIFIDDMPLYTSHSQVRLFADDTIVYLTVTGYEDGQKLQEDLRALERWENEWQMQFHPEKCNVLRITKKNSKVIFPYTLHGHTLEEVSSAKYLGVTISNDMTWNKHTDGAAAKANSKLGFIKRNLKTKDPKMKEKAYASIVRPTLEYCSTVWDPHSKQQANTIERVQRRAARWVTGRYHNTSSVSNMLAELGWRSLSQRRADSRLVMMYKIRHGLVNIPFDHFLSLQRDGIHLQPILARTQYYEYSFFPRTVSDWNAVPRDTLSAPKLTMFKPNIVKLQHTMPY